MPGVSQRRVQSSETIHRKHMRDGIAFTAFTERGTTLAEKLRTELGGSLRSREEPLSEWVGREFPRRRALIFIGAVGIAVRAVAPHLQAKAEDPAVVVLDECGNFAIPLLSGHLGGANAVAGQIAAICGATPVITTATDLQGVFAVDLWAKRQNMTVLQPERIRQVSGKLLRGERSTVACRWPISGEIPQGVASASGETEADVAVDYRCRPSESSALQLVPRILCLGIGCRKGARAEEIREAFSEFCRQRGILPQAVVSVASIDVKRNEEGLLQYCREIGLPVCFFSAARLRETEGSFTASAFVEKTVGVDNVCERAAVLSSGGPLIERKYTGDGVTFALAEMPFAPEWKW